MPIILGFAKKIAVRFPEPSACCVDTDGLKAEVLSGAIWAGREIPFKWRKWRYNPTALKGGCALIDADN
jgi:hypothetical protein